MTLRDYLRANMFDGSEDGSVTLPVATLLDDVCEMVALFFVQQSGAEDHVEAYYLPPPAPKTLEGVIANASHEVLEAKAVFDAHHAVRCLGPAGPCTCTNGIGCVNDPYKDW